MENNSIPNEMGIIIIIVDLSMSSSCPTISITFNNIRAELGKGATRREFLYCHDNIYRFGAEFLITQLDHGPFIRCIFKDQMNVHSSARN